MGCCGSVLRTKDLTQTTSNDLLTALAALAWLGFLVKFFFLMNMRNARSLWACQLQSKRLTWGWSDMDPFFGLWISFRITSNDLFTAWQLWCGWGVSSFEYTHHGPYHRVTFNLGVACCGSVLRTMDLASVYFKRVCYFLILSVGRGCVESRFLSFDNI